MASPGRLEVHLLCHLCSGCLATVVVFGCSFLCTTHALGRFSLPSSLPASSWSSSHIYMVKQPREAVIAMGPLHPILFVVGLLSSGRLWPPNSLRPIFLFTLVQLPENADLAISCLRVLWWTMARRVEIRSFSKEIDAQLSLPLTRVSVSSLCSPWPQDFCTHHIPSSLTLLPPQFRGSITALLLHGPPCRH